MKHSYQNIVRIKVLAQALSSIEHKIVFVGGAVVELYCDDSARAEVRPTDDIDIVIELQNLGSYTKLEETLRGIGFQNDIFSGIICRYKYHDIVVDIMPNDEKILGFTNIWYKKGLEWSVLFEIDEELSISIFPVEYFLASKFEALKSNRHGEDYRWNSDFEDIIYIFDNRINLEHEILNTTEDVLNYIKSSLRELMERKTIEEEISASLDFSGHYARKQRILAIWHSILNK